MKASISWLLRSLSSCVIAQKLANGHLKQVSKLFVSEYTSCLQEQPDAE